MTPRVLDPHYSTISKGTATPDRRGPTLSAGQVNAAIEAAVRREEARYERLHGRLWAEVLHERACRPGTGILSDAAIMADMAAVNPELAGYWRPMSADVELTGLVHTLLRLAQRMHADGYGGKRG